MNYYEMQDAVLARELQIQQYNETREMPWWLKYTLSMEEAAEYYGISAKKLRIFLKDHENDKFIMWNGKKVLIKRAQFEKYIDDHMSVI